jgi:hypothetical protein
MIVGDRGRHSIFSQRLGYQAVLKEATAESIQRLVDDCRTFQASYYRSSSSQESLQLTYSYINFADVK